MGESPVVQGGVRFANRDRANTNASIATQDPHDLLVSSIKTISTVQHNKETATHYDIQGGSDTPQGPSSFVVPIDTPVALMHGNTPPSPRQTFQVSKPQQQQQ